MEIIRTISEMTKRASEIKKAGKTIAVVPTMGYLHEGHLSLMKKAKEAGDFVITTLFVNPSQFGPNEDFDKYPRDEKRDIELSAGAGADAIFIPDKNDIYPQNYRTYITVEKLGEKLCGKTRPTHFRGVTTICLKLFNITMADAGVFGWKDAQQFLILNRMVKDLNHPVKLIGMPIVREEDGLAKSSRNKYLNEEERKQALVLSQSLKLAESAIIKTPDIQAQDIITLIKSRIATSSIAKIDYVEMVSMETLEPLEKTEKNNTLIALAVFFGKTRLIDNIRL